MDDEAATLHRLTRHGSPVDPTDRELLVAFRPLDPSNRPTPFKRYAARDPVPLPRTRPWSDVSAVRALSGDDPDNRLARWDAERVARLLFLANGVSRSTPSPMGRTWFRTAMSAGNLHPLELYVVCGDLDGIPAGVHHFSPLQFGLATLRSGDHRSILAAAAADERVADAPMTIVVSGIVWRTAWKYGERGFRHLYWDAGTMLANLLAVEHRASVLLGFVDDAVRALVGLDEISEHPLALVVLDGRGPHRPAAGDRAAGIVPLDVETEPVAPAPIELPLATAAQHDGDLPDEAAVQRWRAASHAFGKTPLAMDAAPDDVPDEPIEAVILRRGSTRLMRHETARRALLSWGLGVAARAVGGDATAPGKTLLEHLVAVHDVDGVTPGTHRTRDGGLELLRADADRDTTAHLCLDQSLGGDSAFTVFHAADLDAALRTLGSRGYRAVQLAAGVASGRLALAAFALGYGATGLTFYDEEVAAHFGAPESCMLVTSVGVPDYRNTPGGTPGRPAHLERLDQLMERLSLRLQHGRGGGGRRLPEPR